MMGLQSADQRRFFFYDICLEDHVPDDHLLRRIDRLLNLDDVRQQLKLKRTRQRFGLKPERLATDTANGTGRMLGWLKD